MGANNEIQAYANDGEEVQGTIKIPEQAGAWTGMSEVHRSLSMSCWFAAKSDEEDGPGEKPATLALLKAMMAFLNGVTPQLSWLVSANELVRLYLKTLQLDYTQNEPTRTHHHQNPRTGNYYVPIARVGRVMVSMRTWKDNVSFNFRVRFDVLPTDEQEDYLQETLDTQLATLEEAKEKAQEQLDSLPTELREELFDFTPEKCERKPKARVSAGDDFDF